MKEVNIAPALGVTSLEEHLKFDGFDAAEKLTGRYYKDDDSTSDLGVALSIAANANKTKALIEADDTTYSDSLERYLRIVSEEGFKEVLRIPFQGDDNQETFFVFWHDDGLLLNFETYHGDSINSGHVYFNWLGKDRSWPRSFKGTKCQDILIITR